VTQALRTDAKANIAQAKSNVTSGGGTNQPEQAWLS